MDDQFQQASPKAQEMADFTEASDPFALFFRWMKEAEAAEPNRSRGHGRRHGRCRRASQCADDSLEGCRRPRLRLLHQQRERQGAWSSPATPKAALLFYWKSLGRQIRIRGPIEPTSEAEADAYFATRHRESRIGACASRSVAAARKPRRARRGGGAPHQGVRIGRRAAPVLLVRLPASFRSRSSSGGAGPSACMTASCSAALRRATPGPRPASIREDITTNLPFLGASGIRLVRVGPD